MANYLGLFQMPQSFIKSNWPNLNPSNYELKSEPSDKYNCVAWVLGQVNDPIDLSLDENDEPLTYPDLTCWAYINRFEQEGFELCDSPEWEENHEKIAIYELSGKTFEHVALQIMEGVWVSKLGEWEDIVHTSLESLQSNHYYGLPSWFMRRKGNKAISSILQQQPSLQLPNAF